MKKKLTQKQLAKKLGDILWKFLKTLPPAEKKRRTNKLHKTVKEMQKKRLTRPTRLA